jgi:hypothetical protein
MFQRNTLLPSSGWNNKPIKKPAWNQVASKNVYIFCEITLYSPLEIHRHFGGKHLCIHKGSVRQAINQHEAGSKLTDINPFVLIYGELKQSYKNGGKKKVTQVTQKMSDLGSHSYRSTSRSWVLRQKPPILQPLKYFPAFYGTRRFHYSVHKTPPLVPILSHINPIQSNHHNLSLYDPF